MAGILTAETMNKRRNTSVTNRNTIAQAVAESKYRKKSAKDQFFTKAFPKIENK